MASKKLINDPAFDRVELAMYLGNTCSIEELVILKQMKMKGIIKAIQKAVARDQERMALGVPASYELEDAIFKHQLTI